MKEQVRAALDRIEDFLLDDEVRKDVWLVLTALRGPDSGNELIKDTQTVHIRRAAFPRVAAKVDREHKMYHSGAQFATERPFKAAGWVDQSLHFSGHVRSAAEILDLKESTPTTKETT